MAHHQGKNIINSLELDPAKLEKHNLDLKKKYDEMAKNEVRYEMYKCDDADIIAVAFGTTARIVKNTMEMARREGIKMGLIRPISVWPFPQEPFDKTAAHAKAYISVEMNMGQMVEDVRLAVNGRRPVHFYGRTGGMIPDPRDILVEVKNILGGVR